MKKTVGTKPSSPKARSTAAGDVARERCPRDVRAGVRDVRQGAEDPDAIVKASRLFTTIHSGATLPVFPAGRVEAGMDGRATDYWCHHAVKEYMVPAVFIVNSFGISLLKATIVSKPEQWAGTT